MADKMPTRAELEKMSDGELREVARRAGIPDPEGRSREELIKALGVTMPGSPKPEEPKPPQEPPTGS